MARRHGKRRWGKGSGNALTLLVLLVLAVLVVIGISAPGGVTGAAVSFGGGASGGLGTALSVVVVVVGVLLGYAHLKRSGSL